MACRSESLHTMRTLYESGDHFLSSALCPYKMGAIYLVGDSQIDNGNDDIHEDGITA